MLVDDVRKMIAEVEGMVARLHAFYPGDPQPPPDFVAEIRGRYPMGDLYGAEAFLLSAKAELAHVLSRLEKKSRERAP
jgi:hypothetical protein